MELDEQGIALTSSFLHLMSRACVMLFRSSTAGGVGDIAIIGALNRPQHLISQS